MKKILFTLMALVLSFTTLSFSAHAQGYVPDHKILIAYFTWAENTTVADPSAVDVDATTSASVLMPGNVGLLASWIQDYTQGTLFSIQTQEQYSENYEECLDRASQEKDNDIYPALKTKVSNLEAYDIVFLGFPNWWYSCPMAILQFIKENNLEGKTIIPFCAHGTGGLAASLRDIGEVLPQNCNFLKDEVFHVSRPEVKGARESLEAWLVELKGKL